MIRSLLTLTICFAFLAANAQNTILNPDSLAYQNQRKKINNMLTQRSQKFGQYSQSLSKHTGIFGLQTKKDIRRSGDILMDIIREDNSILEQTKVLLSLKDNQLNYRTYQQQSVQTQARETQDVSMGFMMTINKLRTQNEKLKGDLLQAQNKVANTQRWAVILFGVMLGLFVFVSSYKQRNKS